MIEDIINRYKTNDLISVCAKCKTDENITIKHDNKWYVINEPVKDYKKYSHTYCPPCYNKIKQEIKEWRKN